MRALLLLAALAGCGDRALPPADAEPATVKLRVAAAKVGEGEPVQLTVEVSLADGWTLQPGPISAEGLDAEEGAVDGPTQVGDHVRSVHTYALTGPKGSYVVDMGKGTATSPSGQTQDIDPEPIFVDIGVEGPTGGPMADFAPAPPPTEVDWKVVAALTGAGVLALTALGFGLWWWRRRPVPVVPPEPANVLALRSWAEARAAGLDDHALALALSRIFREYLSAVTSWPATAATTREILDRLEGEQRVGPALRLRSARVLDATDRLKFAREGGGKPFFDELEGDFRAVVDATRPSIQSLEAPIAGVG